MNVGFAIGGALSFAAGQLKPFVGWYSAVCLGFGLAHLSGFVKA